MLARFAKASRRDTRGKATLLASALMLFWWVGLASGHRDKGYLYLSPEPNAEYVPPQTQFVLVRLANVAPTALTNLSTFITVTGLISGSHSGQARIASDGETIIFELASGFIANELVTVSLNPLLVPGESGTVEAYAYVFTINGPMPDSLSAMVPPSPPTMSPRSDTGQDTQTNEPEAGPPQNSFRPRILPNGVSVPSDFPHCKVTINSNPAPGFLFVSHDGWGEYDYHMILRNDGCPLFYRRGWGTDFKVHPNGMITHSGGPIAFDKNFRVVRYFAVKNGYRTDFHDFKMLVDGTYFMVGDYVAPVDMSQYVPGGNPAATVRESMIQEFTSAGDLVFQWRGWDHYDVREVHSQVAADVQLPHMNAVTVDEDGGLLISCRHLDEVTKVDRKSGEVVWRLGGPDSDFVFLNDPFNGFSWQHDISALGNGRYMVFDNGTGRSPQVSRAVEYQLDLETMTATLVWEFRDSPDKFTRYMGNAQRLPNGNTLINFVLPGYPKVTEVDRNGQKHFEMNVTPGMHVYRAFRFPWDGVVEVPYLLIEPGTDDLTLLFNKFGDTNVAHYCIYGGTSPQPTTLVVTSPVTLKRLTDLQDGCRYYYRVTAVDDQGLESDYSNEESLLVRIFQPGQNMVLNGDFSAGTNAWTWAVDGTASATWTVTNGASHVEISQPGAMVANIQLSQAGLKLIQGTEYLLEFDAWAPQPRLIEVRLGLDRSPWTVYAFTTCSLTPTRKRFSFPFAMQNMSDLSARLAFRLGTSAADVYLDDVSLVCFAAGDFDRDGCVGPSDLQVLTSQWLNQGSGLSADLNGDGQVDFSDFAVFGENWSGAACPP